MRAREAAMERSLFERLQVGGCPVSVLSVQYRMHPAIRAFPSAHFYGGRLQDGCALQASNRKTAFICPTCRLRDSRRVSFRDVGL